MTGRHEIWWVYPDTGIQLHAVTCDSDPHRRLFTALCGTPIQVRPAPFMSVRTWERTECPRCRTAVDTLTTRAAS